MFEPGVTTDKIVQRGPAGEGHCDQVMAYWSSLRNVGKLPLRTQIDPAALGPALPHVFCAQIVAPEVARMRIVGHRIEHLIGMDLRGMSLTALCEGSARDAIGDAVTQVSMGARVILSLQGAAAFGQPLLRATLAMMPLADTVGRVDRILGVLETRGEIGRSPRRFALARPVDLGLEPSGADAAPRPALRLIRGGRD
ncbi:MAG: PAS domain-containing protein [Roseinatronobacter sp.]